MTRKKLWQHGKKDKGANETDMLEVDEADVLCQIKRYYPVRHLVETSLRSTAIFGKPHFTPA